MAEYSISGQAMTMILARRLPGVPTGQATADIFNSYTSNAQANASVVKFAKQQGVANAKARIYGFPTNVAQAQATIT